MDFGALSQPGEPGVCNFDSIQPPKVSPDGRGSCHCLSYGSAPSGNDCVYDHGEHRESLVDLESDPGEMINLAGDPVHHKVLRQHRRMLAEWCVAFDTKWPQARVSIEHDLGGAG